MVTDLYKSKRFQDLTYFTVVDISKTAYLFKSLRKYTHIKRKVNISN